MHRITPDIADYIYTAYQSMNEEDMEKDKLVTIANEVEKKFRKKFSPEGIRLFTRKKFSDARYQQKTYRQQAKEINVPLSSFLFSLNDFECGNKPEKLSIKNSYVKVLIGLKEYGNDIKGRKLAGILGLTDVTNEFKELGKAGLIENTSGLKKQITKRGIDYLASTGL